MAQDTTPALVIYPGQLVNNTYRTNFEFAFDKGFYGEVKVAFVRRGLTEYEHSPDSSMYEIHGYLYAWNGGVYTKTETATTETPLYDKDGVATGDMWTEGMYREPKNDIISNGYVEWKGDPITENDIICIVRETQKSQPYTYPNNQKHIERALDNLSRQIQELQLSAENALHVDPAWNYTYDDQYKMDPIAWLQTIVRSKGLTLRELRIDNDYIEYTTDDPDSLTKTWNVIAGVKAGNGELISHFRETKILAEDGITWVPFLEYSTDGGNSWKVAGRTASELEHLYVKKAGDTMTGALNITDSGNQNVPLLTLKHKTEVWQFIPKYQLPEIDILHGSGYGISVSTSFVKPKFNNRMSLGNSLYRWTSLYASALNNGYDIAIPVTSSADTLALKSEVDLAANSGTQLRDKGVWYAKMVSTTVPPVEAGVEGRNFADFSMLDENNNPIIVIYTYTNGGWIETERITPPADYNGYLPITSKFWDIQEQAGQQGGQVLWNHTAKTFTPYPRIVSTDSLAITNSTFTNGTLTNVTTEMPANPVNGTIVNKQYVDNAIVNSGTGRNVGDKFLTMRTDNALNGAVECDGATYNTTDFTGAQSIGELLEDGKVPYVSMTDYAADITAKGWCDKFGWDGTGNIQFRVPTLNAYIWQKLQPGIKGSIGQSTASGFGQYFVAQQTSFTQQTVPSSGGYSVTVTNDQTIPGASVDTTNSVSDQRVMVQLAISATDEAVETCTSVLADVAELKYDYVVDFQAPTAANNYTWYRKYKSGWVEQGGQAITNSSNPCAIDLPVEMADTYYNINIMGETITDGYSNATWQVMPVSTATSPKSTTRFYGQSSITGYNLPFYWEVRGMAA